VAAAAVCALATACGGSPTTPTPPRALTIACPAAVEMQSPSDDPVTAHWDAPVAAGGVPPLGVTCSPASGTAFAVGSTTVSCVVTDTLGQTAGCNFPVVVRAAPRLAHTRFLAFGDSLTEGKVSLALNWLLSMPAESYPFKLQVRLAERYARQTVAMVNAGASGELASEGGVGRLPGVLQMTNPDVLLLMEGTNDLFVWHESAAGLVIPALESMIRHARGRGVEVMLATVPPQRLGGLRDRVARLVPAFNQEVRALASREGVILVDVYAAMEDKPSLIGRDDLHMTEEGYGFIAAVFFEAIRTHFEAGAVGTAW
jgi:acyl-CoA thioesterase I